MTPETKLPAQFNLSIIKRFMSDAELSVFSAKYVSNKKKLHNGPKEPTPQQVEIATALKAGETPQNLAAKYGMAEHQIYGARNRVAIWNYIKG